MYNIDKFVTSGHVNIRYAMSIFGKKQYKDHWIEGSLIFLGVIFFLNYFAHSIHENERLLHEKKVQDLIYKSLLKCWLFREFQKYLNL